MWPSDPRSKPSRGSLAAHVQSFPYPQVPPYLNSDGRFQIQKMKQFSNTRTPPKERLAPETKLGTLLARIRPSCRPSQWLSRRVPRRIIGV